jgi:GTP-binding protein Era
MSDGEGKTGNEVETSCGFIAVIGAPNAGKSTLVNTLVGTKVAIVSRKVQTTRTMLRGIAIEGASQLVFIDTPGIFAPKRRLDRAMVEAAWGGAGDADMVLLVVDAAKGIDEDVERILEKLGPAPGGGESQTSDVVVPPTPSPSPQRGGESRRGRGEGGGHLSRTASGPPRNLLLALNKVDRVRKDRLLELAAELNARVPFADTFMISALDGDGVADLKAHLARAVPAGPWHYPADEVTDAPMRVLAAEITREKIYDRLHDELPYQIAVETTAWKEQGKAVRVEQTILVERDSQKRIVLGKSGTMIKQLSMESRKELSEILERPVHLFLFVKVREGWGDDPARYRDLGLTFPKE